MDTRSTLLLFSTLVLVASSLVFGILFLRRRNYLLGLEWLVVSFSATNFVIYMLSGAQAAYSISYFCDAFSRSFGIPVITIAGFMAVTHNYRPSMRVDAWFFGVGILGGFILLASDSAVKPYFYVLMWTVFSLYLVYVIKRLLDVGQKFQAFRTLLALTSSLAIAVIYDFYKIPGDEQNLALNFYFLAGMIWAYLTFELYFTYCALEGTLPQHVSRTSADEI